MKYPRALLLMLLIVFGWIGPTKADSLTEEQQSIATAQKLTQSTVKIDATSTTGSGFFVAPDLILTNWHVVKGASSTIDYTNASGAACKADLVRQEEKIDLALYHSRCLSSAHLPLQETSYLGQTAMVASNPTGFDFSLSKGIVSAYRWDYIQFDAKIKPGSSGGIVANLSGEVIGIVVALAKSEDGIAFAIPARDINQFLARGGN